MKYNYKITVELPRTVYTKQGRDLTVDSYTQFIYGRKNKEMALRAFMAVKNVKFLRKQGFDVTREDIRKNRTVFTSMLTRV